MGILSIPTSDVSLESTNWSVAIFLTVEYKGFSAIQDHANSNMHQKRRREEIENYKIEKYVEKKRRLSY